MGRRGCEMMIECDVKKVQTVESIENTRRERGDGVGIKRMRGELIDKREKNNIEKGGLMNGKEREVILLRLENRPDGRETRLLE